MGRVAKYKKIKACDPFSKRSAKDSNNLSAGGVLLDPRKRRGSKFEKRMRKHLKRSGGKGRRDEFEKSRGFDCPPPEEDDFDLNDPFLTVKATKKPKGNDGTGDADIFGAHPVVSLPDGHAAVSLDEELKTARLLGITSRPSSSQSLLKKGIVEGRKEGESIHDYRRRANDEMRQLKKDIVRDEKKASSSPSGVNGGEGTKHEKRKDYLKNKRRKKNEGRRMAYEAKMANNNKRRLDDDDDDDNDGFVSGDVAKSLSSAPLGDQVERPPMFAVLPRGAKVKTKKAKINGGGHGTVMNDAQREKEQNELEIMRQQAVERYALMKAKRRKAGDFHL